MTVPARQIRRFGPGALATPANFVTMARLVLAVPTLVLIERTGASWVALTLWVVLCSTDGVDGWIARRDGTTRSGAFLDPLADKLLVLGGFVALALRDDITWIPVAIIAIRELGISAYRSAAARQGASLPALPLGKWKAVVQMIAVGGFITPLTESWTVAQQIVLWTAVAITVVSGLDIVRRGWRTA